MKGKSAQELLEELEKEEKEWQAYLEKNSQASTAAFTDVEK